MAQQEVQVLRLELNNIYTVRDAVLKLKDTLRSGVRDIEEVNNAIRCIREGALWLTEAADVVKDDLESFGVKV